MSKLSSAFKKSTGVKLSSIVGAAVPGASLLGLGGGGSSGSSKKTTTQKAKVPASVKPAPAAKEPAGFDPKTMTLIIAGGVGLLLVTLVVVGTRR